MTPQQPIVYIRAGHSGIHPVTGEYLTMVNERAKFFQHKNGKPYHKDGFFFEGASNRRIAAEYVKQATAAGLHVVQVHHPYLDFALGEYCDFANEHAKQYTTPNSPSLFIDIHSNAGRARGFAAFYYPGFVQNGLVINRVSRSGLAAATAMAAAVNPLWLQEGANYGNNPVRPGWLYRNGRIVGPYFMLANTNMPSIIVENGFFDNPADADLLMNSDFCVQLVQRMVHGTWDYFKTL